MNKKILITGVNGQIGSYLADFLLAENGPPHLEVYGLVRRKSPDNFENIKTLVNQGKLKLVYSDLLDPHSINDIFQKYQFDYCFNLAAQSHVHESWNTPLNTWRVNSEGVINLLEAIRKYSPRCRLITASTSEMFGDIEYEPQDIRHPLKARSPYGASKIAAHQLVKVYRESYNLYAVAFILFNTESPRREEKFVTRKITKKIAEIKRAIKDGKKWTPLELGNITAERDWTDARDAVEAIWMVANQSEYLRFQIEESIKRGIKNPDNAKLSINYSLDNFIPKNYIISSGKKKSVKEFVETAALFSGLKGEWIEKDNPLESFFLTEDNDKIVVISEDFYRPAEVQSLCGDSTPIRTELGWLPTIPFDQMVKDMVESDNKNLYFDVF